MTMVSEYTSEQLHQWETYVGLPTKYHHDCKPALNIQYLNALHVHQIAAVPYENLDLHYSNHHSISLDPHVQFNKIISEGRGRGGYCMEGNLLYNHVLKAAGFNAYTVGVRIRPRVDGVPCGVYSGWVHVVNIVTLPTGEKYVSDVAFGGDGPTLPIPLINNHVQTNLGTQEVRLIHSTLPHATVSTPNDKYWFYQYRNSSIQEWNSFYAFTEMEFFFNDFVVMNHFTSTYRGGTNWQTERVLVVRFLKGLKKKQKASSCIPEENGVLEEEEERVVGKVMLVDGVVKRNDGGKTIVVRVCESENQRVQSLEEDFAIKLVREEIEGIKGYRTEIKGI